eukprot:975202-Amphidinium_carterae.1
MVGRSHPTNCGLCGCRHYCCARLDPFYIVNKTASCSTSSLWQSIDYTTLPAELPMPSMSTTHSALALELCHDSSIHSQQSVIHPQQHHLVYTGQPFLYLHLPSVQYRGSSVHSCARFSGA